MTTSQADFRPFEDTLDQQQAQSMLREACAGADDGELFLERRQTQALTFEDRRMRHSSYSADEGFGLRAVVGETTGFAHSNELSEPQLKEATKTVRFAVREREGKFAAPPAPRPPIELYSGNDPDGSTMFVNKVDLLQSIDAYLRYKDPRVTQVSASLATSLQEVEILGLEVDTMRDARPMVRLMVSVIVEENGAQHRGSSGQGGRYPLDRLMDQQVWQAICDEALRIALVGLKAEAAPAGVFDVVLGPGWPGVLLHEAVGHGLEGDFNRKGTSAFADLMGKRVAADGVTVLDDASIPEKRGSIHIDDEGSPGQTTTLIENGILVGYLQDRQNARLTNSTPTGNGRRESHAHMPMPRMTNTFMKAGTEKPEDLVADLKDGIYAVGFGGGQVNTTNGNFVFSCTEAYRVRNGTIGAPVKNATLIGDGPTALQHIKAIGNDLELDPGIGTCGKNGQWVPVGVGLPSLYISGLTIGGQAA